MNSDEILKKLEENGKIIRGFGVRRLGIFGSYARGEQREPSDMDFLVEFDSATFDNYFDLKFFLEDLFDRSVDLVIADTIKQRIRSSILEETLYAEGIIDSISMTSSNLAERFDNSHKECHFKNLSMMSKRRMLSLETSKSLEKPLIACRTESNPSIPALSGPRSLDSGIH